MAIAPNLWVTIDLYKKGLIVIMWIENIHQSKLYQWCHTLLEMNDDSNNVMNSNYYIVNQIQLWKIANKSKSLSVFLINTCSLNKNLNDLKYLLKCTNKQFDVLAVTETKITRNTSKLCNICLKSYAVESNPTESSAGGTLHCKSPAIFINLIMTWIFIKNLN